MNQKELITKFLNLEDEDEEIVEAWNLFIETQKGSDGFWRGLCSVGERGL